MQGISLSSASSSGTSWKSALKIVSEFKEDIEVPSEFIDWLDNDEILLDDLVLEAMCAYMGKTPASIQAHLLKIAKKPGMTKALFLQQRDALLAHRVLGNSLEGSEKTRAKQAFQVAWNTFEMTVSPKDPNKITLSHLARHYPSRAAQIAMSITKKLGDRWGVARVTDATVRAWYAEWMAFFYAGVGSSLTADQYAEYKNDFDAISTIITIVLKTKEKMYLEVTIDDAARYNGLQAVLTSPVIGEFPTGTTLSSKAIVQAFCRSGVYRDHPLYGVK